MWTLEDGLTFIRILQPEAAKLGFNLSLGGGVLNAGKSDHDLDVVVAPAKGATPNAAAFLVLATDTFGLQEVKRRKWNPLMSVIQTRDRQGRVIDFFIVDKAASVPHWLQAEADRKVAEGH